MGKSALGELEIVTLLAVLQAGDEAYGVTIGDQIRARSGRRVARGALYVTLERLAQKGFLRSWRGPTTSGRGGRPRRYYAVTPDGLEAVRGARDTFRSMWSGLEPMLEDA